MTRRAPPIRFVAVLTVGSLLALAPVSGQSAAIVIRAQRIFTVTNGVIENGSVVIENGRITAVGANVAALPGARHYTAHAVIPGLIDAHSHVALDRSGPRNPGYTTADTRTVDQFRFSDPSLRKIVEGGVTTLLVVGSGGGQIFLGRSMAVKLKEAPPDQMVLKEYAVLKLYHRQGVGGGFLTSMGWHAVVRAEYIKAQEYVKRWDDYRQGKTTVEPAVDAKMETLAANLRGEVPLHVHVHWPSEIQTALDVAKEFNMKITFVHANYAYRLADDIRKYGAIPINGPSLIHMWHDEQTPQNAPKLLAEAGVIGALQTDLSGEGVKSFFEEAQLLVRHGMKEEDALRAITLNGAKAIGMESRIGSIEVGKDADLALLDGDPFDLAHDVTHVFIDGKLEFELKDKPQKAQLSAVGPFKPFSSNATAQSDQIAIVNGSIWSMTDTPITRGTLLVDRGTIAAVGPNVAVPAGYKTIDAGGRVVMPGIVLARVLPTGYVSPQWGNTRSIDLSDESVAPLTPDADARYSVDPSWTSWKLYRELGVTSLLVTPGNLNVIGGSGVLLRPLGASFQQMLRDEQPRAMVFGLGRAARATWGTSRLEGGGIEALLRQTLDRAREYRARRERNSGLARDLKLEALLPVLDKKARAVFDADTVQEIRAALRISDDYGLRSAISSGTEAWKVIAELKQRDIPVILGNTGEGWTIGQAIRGGVPGFNERMPTLLAQAGVRVAMSGPGGHRGDLFIGKLGAEPMLNAAWCFRNGMSEIDALKMITVNSAQVAGVDDRLGTLAPGKVADVVIMSGHPLALRSLPEVVLIDGRIVYQRPALAPAGRVGTQGEQ